MLLVNFHFISVIITMFLPERLLKIELKRNECYREYLQYMKSLDKLDKCVLRKKFLVECRNSDIIPKFLQFRIPNNGCFEDHAVHNFQRNLLHKEIAKASNQNAICESRLCEARERLKSLVPNKCVPSVVLYTRYNRSISRKSILLNHKHKIQNLSASQQKPLLNIQNTVKVVGFDKPVPKYVLETLTLGPRNPVLNKFNEKDVLCELDCFLNFCQKNLILDKTITDINVKTLHYIKQCRKQKTPRHLNLTKQFLKDNNLVVVPFDKGIGFCLMTRDIYESKLQPIIDLPQFEKYENPRKNAKHPILKEEERVVNILNKLKAEGKINNELCDQLKPKGSQAPRLYGLAKVHKDNCPVRPVVSMIGSAYQKVAKQVTEWLSLVPECRINSSTQAVNNLIKDTKLNSHECVVSFDVSSLYTNVPVREAIDICTELLFKHVSLPIDKSTFKILAEIASCDVIFATHNGFYKQIDGLAMGSSPAPHLANGWLSQFESTIRGNAALYSRYMDDIICSIETNNIDSHLAMINSIHPNLTFTHEIPKDGRLPFLDMEIINTNGVLSSKWYRKPTDTGLTLNFHSLAPLKYKKSVVISFVYRIFRSCTSWVNFHEGICQAKTILTNNQYPLSFIDRYIKETLHKILSDPNSESILSSSDTSSVSINTSVDSNACMNQFDNKDKFKFFITYRGKPTEQLAKSLKKLNAPCNMIMTLDKTLLI